MYRSSLVFLLIMVLSDLKHSGSKPSPEFPLLIHYAVLEHIDAESSRDAGALELIKLNICFRGFLFR